MTGKRRSGAHAEGGVMTSAPFDAHEWITLAAAAKDYGVPTQIIQHSMLAGDLSVRSVAGETLVRHAEVKALRLRLMGGRCEQCED